MQSKNKELEKEIYTVVKNFCLEDGEPTRGLKGLVSKALSNPDSLGQGDLFLVWDALGCYQDRTMEMEEVYQSIMEKWAQKVQGNQLVEVD